VVQNFGGRFPPTAELLQTLPGIGRSTAAAIAAFCYGERVAILDANVKRVLTRVLGYDKDMAMAAHERALWNQATALLPTTNLAHSMPRYTQAMMDLGATVCTTRKPTCMLCPLAKQCVAKAQGAPEKYPVKTRKLKRSSQAWWLLCAQRGQANTEQVYLQPRPTPGVWAGLYSLPMYDSREALMATLTPAQQLACVDAPAFLHVLTHKDMHLHVVSLPWVSKSLPRGLEGENADAKGKWVALADLASVGLPAPIRKLLV
jgi:A/G-specific adenine glycosylase